MKLLIAALFFCISFSSLAQTRGQVIVVKDPMIDSLIAKRIALSISTPESDSGKQGPMVSQMGYRVQVFYGSDRRQVFTEQGKFNSLYPEINTYISYKEPNYHLRVGDFRTRLDAQRFMNELRGTFPTLFIFREKINAPSLDYDNDK